MIERYTHPQMAAIWDEEAKLRIWLEIELLACEALAVRGEIPAAVPGILRAQARLNAARMREIERDVHHDVIAFVTSVAEGCGPEGRYLHLGLTSSDVLDTGLAVQLVQAADRLIEGAKGLSDAIWTQAERYRGMVMVGRTHGIHAEPITFGLKLAGWCTEMQRNVARLVTAREAVAVMDDTETAGCWVTYLAIGAAAASGNNVSVSDSVSVAESVSVSLPDALAMSKSESVSVTDTPVASIVAEEPLNVTVSDAVAVAEASAANINTEITVSDALAVAESTSAAIVTEINVSDAVGALTDTPEVAIVTTIAVEDTAAVAEAVAAAVETSQVTVSDAIGIAESVAVSLPDALAVTVADAVAVAEASSASIVEVSPLDASAAASAIRRDASHVPAHGSSSGAAARTGE